MASPTRLLSVGHDINMRQMLGKGNCGLTMSFTANPQVDESKTFLNFLEKSLKMQVELSETLNGLYRSIGQIGRLGRRMLQLAHHEERTNGQMSSVASVGLSGESVFPEVDLRKSFFQ